MPDRVDNGNDLEPRDACRCMRIKRLSICFFWAIHFASSCGCSGSWWVGNAIFAQLPLLVEGLCTETQLCVSRCGICPARPWSDSNIVRMFSSTTSWIVVFRTAPTSVQPLQQILNHFGVWHVCWLTKFAIVPSCSISWPQLWFGQSDPSSRYAFICLMSVVRLILGTFRRNHLDMLIIETLISDAFFFGFLLSLCHSAVISNRPCI